MNIYILTDLEGISGIYCKEQVSPEGRRFDEGRRYLTREVNICADECKKCGVDKVYVRDGHGGSYSLIWDGLSQSVDVAISGITGDVRYEGLEDCDAVILLGYHAMAGTRGAILEHTMSSERVQNYWINGVKVGEVGLDAAILTDYKKPIIMVSGDDVVCCEAKEFLPRVTAVEVKKASTCYGGALLAPHIAEERIRKGVRDAIEKFKSGVLDFYETEKPVRFRAEYTERSSLPSVRSKPHITIIDGRTVETEGDTVEDAFYKL
jgi:D-amino peptidase